MISMAFFIAPLRLAAPARSLHLPTSIPGGPPNTALMKATDPDQGALHRIPEVHLHLLILNNGAEQLHDILFH